MKYEFLDHTADAKFRAYGDSLKVAFENAALAMFSILINPDKVSLQVQHNISISAKAKESLLYDFLEELLFLLDTEGFVLSKVENLKLGVSSNDFNLSCIVHGDSFKNYGTITGNVKSVTYNDMLIDEEFSKEKDKKIMLQVVVDL
jgi:SHS2 domain-containing protein